MAKKTSQKKTSKRKTPKSIFERVQRKKNALTELMKSLGAAPTGVYHEEEVIRIVLDVAGKYHVPTNSPKIKDRKLVDNLDYTTDLLEVLQMELDKYVKSIKPSARITEADIDGYETVGDVVDLVAKKV
jgi:hypothetical protein